jgi:hypothetical protein
VPSVTHGAAGAMRSAYTGRWFPWCFRVKVAGHILGGSMELWVIVCVGKWNLLPSNGTWSRRAASEAGSAELQVVLSILPLVSCFSICRFGESFASLWLGDSVCAFRGPLIFFFLDSWLLLNYRNVNNPPSKWEMFMERVSDLEWEF